MALGLLQLTDQKQPSAQTFRVTEPGGSVITGVGLYFASAPSSSGFGLFRWTPPVSVELRPVAPGGNPSSLNYYPGTRVSVPASTVRAAAGQTFSSASEVKFTFPEPIHIPQNTEVAIVISSSADAGGYKLWVGDIEDFEDGSNTKRIKKQLAAGAFFASSNGTTWTPNQKRDLAFKVYRAKFTYQETTAVLVADFPPPQALTEIDYNDDFVDYPANPLVFTENSTTVSVIHPAHGFRVGDTVNIGSNELDSADTINGVSFANIGGPQTITSVDPYGYSFDTGDSASASGRGGGSSLFASEQYVMDEVMFQLDYDAPAGTSIEARGKFATYKPFAESTPTDKFHYNVPLNPNEVASFTEPHFLPTEEQETADDDLKAVVLVDLDTINKYNAPAFDLTTAQLVTFNHFIDYQDSAGGVNRNTLSTIPFVAETSPDGGTTAAKHITTPFGLANTATSIRVYVDAVRTPYSDFTVWYRTNLSSSTTQLKDQNWVAFNKTNRSPNKSNYNDIPVTNDYNTTNEYQFNVYDLEEFDQYQIKITMNATRSTQPPVFDNLRTIATI